MHLIYGYAAFLLCFLAIADTLAAVGGGCVQMSDIAVKNDKDLQAGKQHILGILAGKVNHQPGYKTEVNLPDLILCLQIVAGKLYHYSWTKEEYHTKCVNRALCKNEQEKTVTKDVNCKATYWVKPYENNFKQFNGIKCE